MNGRPRLTVLGTGYLDGTHAACAASLGFDVLGVDSDTGKVSQLNAGRLPFYEPCLGELLRADTDAGQLAFAMSYPQAPRESCGKCTRGRSLRAPRSTSPAWRPLSWSRQPRTRSWLRRSPSSTRWQRCARSPVAMSAHCRRSLGSDQRNLAGVPVCVLGAAFKSGSDDVLDSPALDVAQILPGMGAQVTVHDPAAVASARRACPELGYTATTVEAAQGAHVVPLLTEWPEFATLSPADLGSVVARRNIVDGRNALEPAMWRAAGWNYRAFGVAAAQPSSRCSAVRRSAMGGGQSSSH